MTRPIPAHTTGSRTRGTPSTYVISHTPFTPTGEIDWPGFRAHLARFREAGIGVYVGGSGSGEGYTLLPAEVEQLLAVAVEELSGAVPVRAMGVEPRTAREMRAFSDVVAAAGMDAMQVYSLDVGHLGVPHPDDLRRFYTEVLEHTSMPVVLSTHFSVGYLVPVEVLVEMTDRFDHVVGVNCSITGEATYLVQLLDALDPRVEVHVGGPFHTMSALALGATGYLSSEANLAPKLAKSLVTAFADGDYVGAQDAYHKMMTLFSLNMTGKAGKALQRHLGLPGGHPRPPRSDRATPEAMREACAVIRDLGVDELLPLIEADDA